MSRPVSMKQYVNQTSNARLTLQPVLTYVVKVDGRVVFFSEDFRVALGYIIAWRANHEDKKRIRLDVDGRAEWKRVNSADGTETADFG